MIPRKITGWCSECGHVELCWSPLRHVWACADCGRNAYPPPPASPEAVAYHCSCDSELNNDGRIMPLHGWLRDDRCPVHLLGDHSDYGGGVA